MKKWEALGGEEKASSWCIHSQPANQRPAAAAASSSAAAGSEAAQHKAQAVEEKKKKKKTLILSFFFSFFLIYPTPTTTPSEILFFFFYYYFFLFFLLLLLGILLCNHSNWDHGTRPIPVPTTFLLTIFPQGVLSVVRVFAILLIKRQWTFPAHTETINSSAVDISWTRLLWLMPCLLYAL